MAQARGGGGGSVRRSGTAKRPRKVYPKFGRTTKVIKKKIAR